MIQIPKKEIMETTKTWQKISESKYIFWVEEKKIGEMELLYPKWSRSVMMNIEGQLFTLEYTGFWKSSWQILDYKGNVILKAYNEKWFSRQTTLEYQNNKLQLVLRNAPLAEFAITKEGKDLLSYGLKIVDGKAVTQIKTSHNHKDYLLDYILWFLFCPIARENSGDNLVFLTLLMSS